MYRLSWLIVSENALMWAPKSVRTAIVAVRSCFGFDSSRNTLLSVPTSRSSNDGATNSGPILRLADDHGSLFGSGDSQPCAAARPGRISTAISTNQSDRTNDETRTEASGRATLVPDPERLTK